MNDDLDIPLPSVGLRRFHEVCVAPAPPEALEGTWYTHKNWVAAHVPQESILQLYMMLFEELRPISQAEDDTSEGRLSDAIRLAGDILWYAMNEETAVRLAALFERRDEAPQSSGAGGGAGNSTR